EEMPARTRPTGVQPVTRTGSQPHQRPVTGAMPAVRPGHTLPPVSKQVPSPGVPTSERRSDQLRSQRPTDQSGPIKRPTDQSAPFKRPTDRLTAPPPVHVDTPLIEERIAAFRDFDEATHDERGTGRPDRAATVMDP